MKMVVSNFIQILSYDFLVGIQGTWGKFLGQNIVSFWIHHLLRVGKLMCLLEKATIGKLLAMLSMGQRSKLW